MAPLSGKGGGMPPTSALVPHMRRALRLAARGRGRTLPNPLVGAVLVRDGVVVGEGWHRVCGGPHAEIEALRAAGAAARGATLYVTLEPCCHHGRTGPCTEAIIAAGVARVVAAMEDPNPLVAGKGYRVLEAAGIAVESGVLEDEARRLNQGHVTRVTKGRPWVTLKLAATLDGRIAAPDGDARWVSCAESRRRVHRMRAEHDAVAVGAGTVRQDDPQLTVRDRSGRTRRQQPLRIVFDGALELSPEARLLRAGGGAVLVVASSAADVAAEARLTAAGARVLRVPAEATAGRPGDVDLPAALRALADVGLTSVLVEGGSQLATALLRAGLVDRLAVFLAPKLMGGKDSVPMFGALGVERMDDVLPLLDAQVSRSGVDVLVTGRPGRPGVRE
jgi:diaminohydroxyphosphoribosylaminopyrimidine deaminase/5-amino-6-(5-phosphoribosylamino)uracil reductase